MNLRPLHCLALLVLGAVVSLCPAAASAQPATRIVTEGPATAPAPPGARWARPVHLDVARLAEAAEARRAVVLDLAPGVSLRTTPERVAWRGPGRFTWFGAVAGGGRATLTVEGAHVVGRLVTPDGVVLIEPSGGAHVAYAPAPLPGEQDDALPPPPPARPVRSGAADELFPDELHLALFYTSQVADSLGTGLGAFLQSTADVLSDVLANSAVPAQARLVYAAQVVHTETETLSENLGLLFDQEDGQMDEVHALRTAYSADFVALLVETGTNSATGCGVAYLMSELDVAFEYAAFSVTKRRCAVAELTFPHEVGHNLGLHHDVYVAPGPGAFAYSHGYVNLDSLDAPSGRPGFRTVLAYNGACTDAGGTCFKIPYYSNPEFLFDGQRMGDASFADNARSTREALPYASAFRAPQLLGAQQGGTAGAPTWTRPACPDPADLAACAPSGSATAVPYRTASLRVASDGLHYVRSAADFDGVLLLYAGGFDPAAPLGGLAGYAAPDPAAPAGRRLLLPAPLQAGVDYVLVTTGVTDADAGAFTTDVYGPAGGGVVIVGAEDAPGTPATFDLSPAAPNPFAGRTQLTLAVAASQRVEVAVYDALGRRVAVLHDGPLAAGRAHALPFDGAGVAPGVYVVRVRGERFQATTRVTRLP
jgi:hypothetical protein